MSLSNVPVRERFPDEVNVIIEIPAHSDPVKYEVDKASGALFVDRFMCTAMHYPCNYGYVPHTISDDGDPADVLVPTPFPLQAGCVIPCRPVGVLMMTDEAGTDEKLLAVPLDSITRMYSSVRQPSDLPSTMLAQISHFFDHYKDLEPGKWVRIDGWGDNQKAKDVMYEARQRFENSPDKPAF